MVRAELEELLSRPRAQFLAFEASGGRTITPPAGLSHFAEQAVLHADTPLDLITPEAQGRAVAAFEHARRSGTATTTITKVDDDGEHQLHILDATAEHGCFVAVVVPTAGERGDRADHNHLPPLRAEFTMGITGLVETISTEFTQMLGWEPEDVVGRSSLDFIHPDEHETGIVAWVEMLERPGGALRIRQRFAIQSGGWLWCEVTDTNRLDDPGAPRIVGEVVDISREMSTRVALEQRERLLDRLTRALPTGVCLLDADGAVTFSNARWSELTGLDADDGLDRLIDLLTEPERLRDAVERSVKDGADADLDIALTGRGACQFGTLHLRPLDAPDERPGLLLTLDDHTNLRTTQMQLTEQARRDPLTGLLNRSGIYEELTARLDRSRTTGSHPAVLFVDLDRFKQINDRFGHAAGDEVLRRVAAHLRHSIGADDVVGRLGGDEFLIVLDGGRRDRPIDDVADELAERITSTLPRAARHDDGHGSAEPGASVGVEVARPGDDYDAVLQRADQAMYDAKRAGYGAGAADDRRGLPRTGITPG